MPNPKESGRMFARGYTGAEVMELVNRYATLVVAHDELMVERDALREALSAVIDQGVVNWHDASDDTRHVHEALGLTFEQYAAWVERNWQKFVKACPS